MSLTFEQVMGFTRHVGSHAAFEDQECKALFDLAMQLEKGETIVEVGCEFGRSTSILAQVAKYNRLRLHCIDPFVDPTSATCFMAMMRRLEVPFTLHCCRTAEVDIELLGHDVSLLHIDGDHTVEGINTDCGLLLSEVVPGGYICFHDYGRDSLPTVFPTVNKHMASYRHIGTYGTLGVWR